MDDGNVEAGNLEHKRKQTPPRDQKKRNPAGETARNNKKNFECEKFLG